MNITDYLKKFDEKVTEMYPDLELYHEYDAELDMYFIWHTIMKYDNDDAFELKTYRLAQRIFEDNGIYNVIFSSMLENHLLPKSKDDDTPTFIIMKTEALSDIAYYKNGEEKSNSAAYEPIMLSTPLKGKKTYTVLNQERTCNECNKPEVTAEGKVRLAA